MDFYGPGKLCASVLFQILNRGSLTLKIVLSFDFSGPKITRKARSELSRMEKQSANES